MSSYSPSPSKRVCHEDGGRRIAVIVVDTTVQARPLSAPEAL